MMQYATDVNLAARQRLWAISERNPAFDFYSWVLALVPTGRTLDVGCGNGAYLDATDAIGMDLSPGMLHAARKVSNASLVCGDAQAIPFAGGAFDVVIAPHMLYHVPDREQAARELRRVTRAGGTCVVVTNSATNHAEMVAMVEDVVGGGWRWRRPSDVSFSMENGAAQLRAGFADIETVWAPQRVFFVTDADAYADYVASVGDTYGEQIDGAWAAVVDECRRRVSTIIDRDGSFPISSSLGAFVCR